MNLVENCLKGWAVAWWGGLHGWRGTFMMPQNWQASYELSCLPLSPPGWRRKEVDAAMAGFVDI